MKEQQVKNRQANSNEEQHWGLVLSNIKEGDKIIETENVCYWCRNRQTEQWDEIVSSETHTVICGNLIWYRSGGGSETTGYTYTALHYTQK